MSSTSRVIFSVIQGIRAHVGHTKQAVAAYITSIIYQADDERIRINVLAVVRLHKPT